MALIPLKQMITVSKADDSVNSWGETVEAETLELKARVVEETKVITANSGREAVTSLRITLDKLADISYDDTITYMDENGVTVERKPLSIAVKRGVSGKPLLTEVLV